MARCHFIIRPALPDDAEQVRAVHRAAVSEKAAVHYTAEQIASWSPPNTPELYERSRRELADAGMIAFVAETPEGIIGFAMAVPATGELRAVYTAPAAGKGVGAALLAKLEETAAAQGVSSLTCDSSLNAEAFYRKHGYGVIERKTHTLNGRNGYSLRGYDGVAKRLSKGPEKPKGTREGSLGKLTSPSREGGSGHLLPRPYLKTNIT